jgi:hypothetical protein
MFKYYTEEFKDDNFKESRGILRKAIYLAYKEGDTYYPLLDLRITDKTAYFNERGIDLVQALNYLGEFNFPLKPTHIPPDMIIESNNSEIELFKEEFEKRF